MQRSSLLILALISLCCSSEVDPFAEPETEVQCKDDDDHRYAPPTAAVNRLEASNDDDGALLAWGTATTTRHLAIRTLTVQGVQVVNAAYNYSHWNVTLPESTFRRAVNGSEVKLAIRGNDPCNSFEADHVGELPEALLAPDPEEPNSSAGAPSE